MMMDIDRKTVEQTLSDGAHGLPPLPSAPNILELLDGVVFPVSKIELVEFASRHEASEEAMEELTALPDKIYRNMNQLNHFLGMIEHQPGEENLFSSEESRDLPDEHDRRVTELNGSGRV